MYKLSKSGRLLVPEDDGVRGYGPRDVERWKKHLDWREKQKRVEIIALVNSAVGSTASGQTCTSSLTPTTGNFVAAWCATKAGDTITNVKDNLGNSLSTAFNSTRYALLYQENVPNGVTGYTLTVGVSNCALIVQEFSGIATTSSFDAAGTIKTSSGTSQSSNALTSAGDIILGYFYQTTSTADFSAGTNYTLISNQDLTAQSENLGGVYRIISGGSQTAVATTVGSVNWAGNAASFKAAGGGGGINPSILNQNQRGNFQPQMRGGFGN